MLLKNALSKRIVKINIMTLNGYFRLFPFLFLLVPLAMPSIAESENLHEKQILVINSYRWGMSWADGEVAGFQAGLKEENVAPTVFLEQMDIIGRTLPFDDDVYINYLKSRFGDRQFDLVVVTDDAALDFVARQYHNLFKGIPVVFSDVHGLDEISIPPDMPLTGVKEHHDFISTLNLARKLRPNARKVVVFGNQADNGSGPRGAQQFLSEWKGDIPVEFHLDKSLEELHEIASKLDPQDILFTLAHAQDALGVRHVYNLVRADISIKSSAPLFTFWSSALKQGTAVGGKVSDSVAQGRAAAKLAVRILRGENPDNIPIIAAPTNYIFDYPMLKRHQIDEADLPQGSTVLHRPYSVYEDYKWLIWGAAALIVFLIIVIFVLLTNIRKRKSAERALAASRDQLEDQVVKRTSELTEANESLSDMLAKLEKTQEQLIESEKMAALGGLVSGVAHEINTPLGVSLTAASHFEDSTVRLLSKYEKDELSQEQFEDFLSEANMTATILQTNLRQAAELISSFKQVAVDQSVETARSIDLNLYLKTTIDSLRPELKAGRHDVTIDCPDGIVIETYPGIISQIITNLVMNSALHGFGADRTGGEIHLEIHCTDKMVTLQYRDNGKGMSKDVLKSAFDPFFTTARGQGGSGLGLSIVYNLVNHKLNGQMVCDSSPGKGTFFTITFPRLCETEVSSVQALNMLTDGRVAHV